MLGGYSNKDGIICGKCYDIYTATGKKFKQNLSMEEIKSVVGATKDSVEIKPFIIEILEIPISNIMKSPKKSKKWSVIFLVIAFLLTLLIIEEPIKYMKDGAKVKFYFVDEEREWVNTNKYQVFEIFEAEKDGQIIRMTSSYYEYTDSNGIVTRRERTAVSPWTKGDYCRIYRENGKWKLARNSDPKSLMLLSFFPIILYSLSVILIIHTRKTKNNESDNKESSQEM